MICSKILKKVVGLIHLWVWCTSNIVSIHVKASSDSMRPGDTLNNTSELCSKHGKYCTGVGLVGYGKLSYLRTYDRGRDWVVWVGNRNQPGDPDSTVLSLDHAGVLKIESKTEKPVILYSSPQPLNNSTEVVATLLDTGNFVLQQIQPNRTIIMLWQSFDYPFDSLVPGMKLGVNHKTGHKWSLTSSLSDSILASGPFRLEWEPKREELIIKHREQVYWKSGKLRNNKQISPQEYKIVSIKDEEYFQLTTTNNEDIVWTLLPTGQLINKDRHDIARADKCYGYNTDGGCQIWEKIPSCRNRGDVFELKKGYPNYTMTVVLPNATYSKSECQAICWSNCSCDGFRSYDHDDGTGCELLPYMKGTTFGDSGDSFYMLVSKTHHKGKKKWIWISEIIAAALLILFLALKKQKLGLKEKKTKKRESIMLDSAASNESSAIKDLEDELKGHNFKVFNYTSILAATASFSPENKLGEGGYGPVYKGTLPTGQEVAVKRLSKTSGQGIMEFKNELTLICELQHKNLVQLLGCCIHEEDRILIYEYMSNKSLDFYLFDCTRRKFLDWKKRFNIIEGISQGVLYLHKYSRLKIIHRDLKASNILLDENMSPKISDFGMARMFTQQESIVNTNRIVGTYGYMSPEYAMEGVCSTKSDVYSFGVLLLEIVSGRRNNSFYSEDRPLTLIGYAWELWKEGDFLRLMDASLSGTFIPDQVQRCIHVALLCVEHYANDRPTMSDIISMLTNKNAIVTLPRRPAFYVGKEISEGTTSSKTSETWFSKEISTSCEVE